MIEENKFYIMSGVVVGICICAVSICSMLYFDVREHIYNNHAIEKIDDTQIQPPACAIIYRMDTKEGTPVATIGSCTLNNESD